METRKEDYCGKALLQRMDIDQQAAALSVERKKSLIGVQRSITKEDVAIIEAKSQIKNCIAPPFALQILQGIHKMMKENGRYADAMIEQHLYDELIDFMVLDSEAEFDLIVMVYTHIAVYTKDYTLFFPSKHEIFLNRLVFLAANTDSELIPRRMASLICITNILLTGTFTDELPNWLMKDAILLKALIEIFRKDSGSHLLAETAAGLLVQIIRVRGHLEYEKDVMAVAERMLQFNIAEVRRMGIWAHYYSLINGAFTSPNVSYQIMLLSYDPSAEVRLISMKYCRALMATNLK